MKGMDTITGNKLIAEFMGCYIDTHYAGNEPVQRRGFKETHITERWHESCFDYQTPYHSSWDWIMPVVEKIMTHRYPDYYGSRGKTEDDGDYDDCAYLRTFGMRDKAGNYMVRFNASSLFIEPTLIEATWLAVIDFIQWYNSNPYQHI